MNFIRLSYIGIQIPFIIETSDFIVLPKDYKQRIDELRGIKNHDRTCYFFFHCFQNSKAQMHVLLKRGFETEFTINNILNNIPDEFKLFELLVSLIFSIELIVDSIFILEESNSKYIPLKCYKIIDKILESDDI